MNFPPTSFPANYPYPQTTTGNFFDVPFAKVAPLDYAYFMAQPPAIQALLSMPNQTTDQQVARLSQAKALAAQGYQIDVPIMVWGWDPFVVQSDRINFNLTWVPSGPMANIPTQPGDDLPGLPPYDPNKPPVGAITLISINPDDYKPWPVPVAPPPPATSPVGPAFGLTNGELANPVASINQSAPVFATMAQQHYPEGYVYPDTAGHKYYYHLLGHELMGGGQLGVWIQTQ